MNQWSAVRSAYAALARNSDEVYSHRAGARTGFFDFTQATSATTGTEGTDYTTPTRAR